MTKDTQRVLLGIVFIIIGISILLIKDSQITAKDQTLEDEPVSVVGLSANVIEENKVPRQILIPSLSLDLPVKKAEVINGYWEVFDDTAAWGNGSGIPGEKGNTVIFAHAKKELFAPIKNIEIGSKIIVFTDKNTYQYTVESLEEVSPRTTRVISATEDETVTLYTCSGYNDSKRFIVKAKRS